MKLAAIYNVWDGAELLSGSVNCIKDHVDLIIIVWQDVSNFGEPYNPIPEVLNTQENDVNYLLVKYIPDGHNGAQNERNKRNLGLDIARRNNCTHFLHMDCDEYYQDFGYAKEKYVKSGKAGSVCNIITYFKKPTWQLDRPDGYFVPFIHELKADTVSGVREYPFYVDPTRRINEINIAHLDVTMHHFSWVRKDIQRKARNSSAKRNIEKGTMLQDYYSPELDANPEGFYVRDFDRNIRVVDDWFGLQHIHLKNH